MSSSADGGESCARTGATGLGVGDRPGKRIRASTHNMEREIKTMVRSRRVSRETVGRKGSIRNAMAGFCSWAVFFKPS